MIGLLHEHRVLVERRLSRATYPDRDYRGRCYEKSLRYVMTHMKTVPELLLVHGLVRIVGVTLAHAWVECPGVVFDATVQEFYDQAAYYRLLDAKAERRYTSVEVCKQVAHTGHWGPWHESSPEGGEAIA